MLVISGPSGAGKTTIVAGLLERRPDIRKSVSVTTRQRRPREREGIDYEFVSDAEFDRLIAQDAFLEWANVHGNRYGTLRSHVREGFETGRTVVLEIDIQGARSVRDTEPDAILVFIDPPSWDVLERRLIGRGTDPQDVIERRLRNAKAELEAAAGFDHRVVNDDLDLAIDQVIRILDAGTPARGGDNVQETP